MLLAKMVYGVQKQLPKERETPHQAVSGEACAARAKADFRRRLILNRRNAGERPVVFCRLSSVLKQA